MKSLDWEEFKKILNKVNKEHKVKYIPTSTKGKFDIEFKGKGIRYINPIVDMVTNEINIISLVTIEGDHFKFSTSMESIYDNLYDTIINWLEV